MYKNSISIINKAIRKRYLNAIENLVNNIIKVRVINDNDIKKVKLKPIGYNFSVQYQFKNTKIKLAKTNEYTAPFKSKYINPKYKISTLIIPLTMKI